MNARTITAGSTFEPKHNLALGCWRLADPKISLASAASMFLGVCAAAAVAPLDWFWLAATVLGIFAIEVAKNASGELYDYDSGADRAVRAEDRTPFSGGKRVLVDGLLTREDTWFIAVAGYLLGSAAGVMIALLRAPAVLWIGLAGVALAWQYHAPPLKLAYRGLGELAVALCYGPLIALGTYLVQTGELSGSFALAAVPLGILIAGFLWVNEFPDFAADESAGKKTLVVRLGRERAARVFLGMEAVAFALLAALPAFGTTHWTALGLVGVIPAAVAATHLLRMTKGPGNRYVPAQRAALLAFLLAAAGEGIGFWLGAST